MDLAELVSSGLNYRSVKLFFGSPGRFEPSKFDCICEISKERSFSIGEVVLGVFVL